MGKRKKSSTSGPYKVRRTHTSTKPKHRVKNPDYKKYVVNLSKQSIDTTTTEALSHGLKFVPNHQQVSDLVILQEAEIFFRRLRLRYQFYGCDDRPIHPFRGPSDYEPDTTLSSNLERYITLTRDSLIATTHQLPRFKPNMTSEAYETLVQLSKSDTLIVKPCDKGGAIAIMDQSDYQSEAFRQLTDRKNYLEIESPNSDATTSTIYAIVNEMYESGEIDDDTYTYLQGSTKPRTPHFYLLPKIHKTNHPGRPILSGNDGPTERISQYLDHFLRPITCRVASFVKDTGDFLLKLDALPPLHQDTILVTWDVSSLYTNIPHSEAIRAVLDALRDCRLSYDIPVPEPRRFVQFLNLILKGNEFQFGQNHYYRQIEGCAMGSTVSPSLAIIFMHYLETSILSNAPDGLVPAIFWRYIDDCFSVWNHGEQALLDFHAYLNRYHKTIKFEMQYSHEKVPFLDVEIYKPPTFAQDGRLGTRVYTKPTDAHPLLHAKSNHPPHCGQNIAFAQALRYKKICSDPLAYIAQCEKLYQHLTPRGYSKREIKHQIERANRLLRSDLLLASSEKDTPSIPFIVPYHDNTDNLRRHVLKYWYLIQQCPHLHQIFKEPPRVIFRRQPNLRDLLVRAKCVK